MGVTGLEKSREGKRARLNVTLKTEERHKVWTLDEQDGKRWIIRLVVYCVRYI